MDKFSGQTWSGNERVQEEFAHALADATTFEGETSRKYSAFSARDRITRSPQGLGFVDLSPELQLTDAGEEFIRGNRPHEIFFETTLKNSNYLLHTIKREEKLKELFGTSIFGNYCLIS